MKSLQKFFLLLIAVALVAGGIYYFRDTNAPELTLTPDQGPVSHTTALTLKLTDSRSGLKHLQATVIQGDARLPLLKRDFPAATHSSSLKLDLSPLKLQEGEFQIEILAGDRSIYRFGKGNQAAQTFSMIYDTRPPIISVLSKAHNFTRGGSGLVTFNLNEPVTRAGVQFGDLFFPAYRQESGAYACLFAYPYFVAEKDFVPRVVARDQAGNERQAGIYYRANDKRFRQRKINISDGFLQTKAPEFAAQVSHAETPLEIFLYVNDEMRRQNRAKMAELGKQSASSPLWEGAFLRQPQAASLAFFADHRTYYYQGQEIDKAVHLGHDLASVAQAEIIAENSGNVVWADYLGIYGLCVVIDHGLGLQSLYAHMSQLDAQVGDRVKRGGVIGRSGTTGLAGGDHLHLGMFVSGIPVQPIEWWDSSWLKNNIDSKLQGG